MISHIPNVLCRIPLLRRQLGVGRIVNRRVQNGDAHVAILVDIRMPHLGGEAHSWRRIWIVVGKFDV